MCSVGISLKEKGLRRSWHHPWVRPLLQLLKDECLTAWERAQGLNAQTKGVRQEAPGRASTPKRNRAKGASGLRRGAAGGRWRCHGLFMFVCPRGKVSKNRITYEPTNRRRGKASHRSFPKQLLHTQVTQLCGAKPCLSLSPLPAPLWGSHRP